MSSDELDISSFANGVARLKEAFAHPPQHELERDGWQRFECTDEPAVGSQRATITRMLCCPLMRSE